MKGFTRWLLTNLESLCVGWIGAISSQQTLPRPAATCTSHVCVDLAQQLARQTTYNTTRIDLCNDFESFVCDGWRAEHDIRPDQGSVIYHNLLQDRSTDVARAYLEASKPPISTPADRKSFAMAKKAYEACMNETRLKEEGIAPLLTILSNIANILHVDETMYTTPGLSYIRDPDATELSDLLLYLQKTTGRTHILDISVTRDNKNPSKRIIHVATPSQLTLSKDYYQNAETMANYTSVMTKVLSAVHPNTQARTNIAHLTKLVVDYEIRIASVLPDLSELHSVKKYYNIISLSNTADLAPIFHLDRIIKGMTLSNYSADRIMTSFPTLIENLAKITRDTSKEVVQTYFMWRVIDGLEYAVLAPELEPLRILKDILGGRDPTAHSDRWRACVSHVSDIRTLGWILSRFYAAQHFSAADRALGQQLVTYVKNQYARTIQALPWLDDPVRAVATQKIEKLQALIGYPDSTSGKPVDLTDAEAVLQYYANVKITDDYFSNVAHLTERAVARDWSRLGTPYDEGEWLMTAQTVNAYNDIGSGVVAFPAAILQPPYFGAGLPSYINFGVTGWTIGHEVSHSFDSSGRQYDLDGAYGNDWWTKRTDREFQLRAQCFVEQYERYTVPGLDGKPLHLNGKLTLGENIADAGGIDTAFLAWQQHRVDYPEQDGDLPGLERWTHEQLYFIAFASLWCSKSESKLLVSQVYDDPHSRPQFRVKGTLENSRYFREHFGCPVKEPTCEIW